jgi:hypothetical protein
VAEPGLLDLFVRPLHAAGIAYFVTGGVATIVYGEPRFTRDIDLVLAVRPGDAERFLSLWPEGEFYAPPIEVFEAESGRVEHGHFNVVHVESGLAADCYVAGDDPLHAWAFERVQTFDVDGLPVRVAPVEYVIVRKLSYFARSGSTRHLEDIARMRRVQGDAIDVAAVEAWVRTLGLEAAWAAALASA